MDKGIDYGHGITNIDHKTGIRYGVIPVNEVLQVWADDSEGDYGSPTCPECGNPAREAKGQYKRYRHAAHSCDDLVCHNCRYVFDSESAFPEEAIAYTYDKEGYKASQSGDDTDIFVLESPYYTLCQFCSPCAPGAGYLLNHCADGIKTYCFGHEWFEGGIAPYPVYRVSDNEIVLSEV